MEYLTLPEFAEYIKKPKMWCYKHAFQFGIKQGRRWLFTREWIDKFMDEARENHLRSLNPYEKELSMRQMIQRSPHRKKRTKSLDPGEAQKRINKLILENPHFYSKSLVRSILSEAHEERR